MATWPANYSAIGYQPLILVAGVSEPFTADLCRIVPVNSKATSMEDRLGMAREPSKKVRWLPSTRWSISRNLKTFTSFFLLAYIKKMMTRLLAIWRLYFTLSCTMSIGLVNCMFLASMFCFMFSIYFNCFSWFLLPIMHKRNQKRVYQMRFSSWKRT